MTTHWFVAQFGRSMGIDLKEYPRCMRCNRELSPDICDEEFISTGICADCWTPEDESKED